jgi:hypothetical protein
LSCSRAGPGTSTETRASSAAISRFVNRDRNAVASTSAACFSWSNGVRTDNVAAEASLSGRRPRRREPLSQFSNDSATVRSKRSSHSGRFVRNAAISPSGTTVVDSNRSLAISSES